MFALFYAKRMQLIPNCTRIDMRTIGEEENVFPKLTALLTVICLNAEDLDAFCASLGLTEDLDSESIPEETLVAIKQKYGVQKLRMDQIKRITDKIASRQ